MLSKWVRAHDPDVALAKRRLDKTPLSETTHGVKVLFPFADKRGYKAKFTNEEINAGISRARVRDVPIAALRAIQHSVRSDRVKEYLDHPDAVPPGAKHPSAGTPIDKPVVVKSDGVLYIHDGHHRITAEALLGADTASVRLVDLDE